MAEVFIKVQGSKEEKYAVLYGQIESLTDGESDLIANMANISAMIHETFGFLWTGFYRVSEKKDMLILGPFQGPLACSRIQFGKGVCGTAWAEERIVVVPDVDKFPGHIACSSLSKSEIVIPLRDTDGKVVGVLDIDSSETDTFDDTDSKWLEKITNLITLRL